MIGEWAYIKGANKLKNISVLSSRDEPSQIGEGVEMVNGIMGYGSSAFYGIKAVRFVMGRFSSLKYGARLVHSILGDNSTVSCCEILNNLIFPVHEQHHNNSFLIATQIQGMSNIAAGATIGSNHNSRTNDGEIRAGRGFWPGLSCTLKHSSVFACFILIAKGDYPYELNITLPFSLVNNNMVMDQLEVMPAYFWMYNLYALERNSWKTKARDRRKQKVQQIESDYLAPDTVEEIIQALEQMESWMKQAGLPIERMNGTGMFPLDNEDPESKVKIEDDNILAKGMERHDRKTVILKPRKAMAAYREMLLYYAIKTLADYLLEKPELAYTDFVIEMESLENNSNERITKWTNLGGQIVPAFRLDELRDKIGKGEIDSWNDIHAAYDEMNAVYVRDKTRHAWKVYKYLNRQPSVAGVSEHPLRNFIHFKKELETLILIRRGIAEQVYKSRAKDFDDPFRAITYRNKDEMQAVVGNAKDNSFVKLVQERTKVMEDMVNNLKKRSL